MQLLLFIARKTRTLQLLFTQGLFFLGRYDHMLGAQNTPDEGMEADGECVELILSSGFWAHPGRTWIHQPLGISGKQLLVSSY